MFPFDKHGGVLHLSPEAAERVAFLAIDTGRMGESLGRPGTGDTRHFAAERVCLVANGWVRAVAARAVGDARIMADVLFAPGEVLAIHNEWPPDDGPGVEKDSAPKEERIARWEDWWNAGD